MLARSAPRRANQLWLFPPPALVAASARHLAREDHFGAVIAAAGCVAGRPACQPVAAAPLASDGRRPLACKWPYHIFRVSGPGNTPETGCKPISGLKPMGTTWKPAGFREFPPPRIPVLAGTCVASRRKSAVLFHVLGAVWEASGRGAVSSARRPRAAARSAADTAAAPSGARSCRPPHMACSGRDGCCAAELAACARGAAQLSSLCWHRRLCLLLKASLPATAAGSKFAGDQQEGSGHWQAGLTAGGAGCWWLATKALHRQGGLGCGSPAAGTELGGGLVAPH